jgi:hypothetical protein
MVSRWIAIVGLASALCGCELLANIPGYTSSSETDAAPGDDAADDDAMIDAMAECQLSTECTAPEICIRGTCGLCDDDADCGVAAENVCLPDGTCAATNRIAYASVAGGGTCALGSPCTIEQAFSMAAGSPAIDIVKLAPETYSRTQSITTTDTVLLAGQGATLTAADTIQMLRVEAGGNLTIIGLTLVGNQQYNALCFGAAGTPSSLSYFRVTSTMGAYGIGGFSCALDVTRSTLIQQTLIGAYVSAGSARFINSVIIGNGTAGGGQGGIYFNGAVDARVQHSTIAGNTSTNNMTSGGITCGTSTNTITSSIIWGNAGTTLIDPACAVDHSIVELSYTGGTANLAMDPLFMALGDFHLQATSPARGAAAPGLTTSVDRDNEPRPQTGTVADCGADEVP